MKDFVTDLKLLVQKHWKVILLIAIVIELINGYSDIKSGIFDGWISK